MDTRLKCVFVDEGDTVRDSLSSVTGGVWMCCNTRSLDSAVHFWVPAFLCVCVDKCLWEGRRLVPSLTLEHSKHASTITHWPGCPLCKSTIYTLFTHCSPMVHPLFTNHSPTVHQPLTLVCSLFANWSQAVYPPSTTIHPLFTNS